MVHKGTNHNFDIFRESNKSFESTEMPQKSFSPIYKPTFHSNAYQDFEEKPLIIEEKDEKPEDELCFGETLDLSCCRKADSTATDEMTTKSVLQFGSTHHLPILPLHINTPDSFRQGS